VRCRRFVVGIRFVSGFWLRMWIVVLMRCGMVGILFGVL